VAIWSMVELDADDALASTAHLAAAEKPVQRVIIWTPDKDLARCVRGNLVVQADRRSKATCDAAGIRSKFGVEPGVISDLLVLVGAAAEGNLGGPGIGRVTVA